MRQLSWKRIFTAGLLLAGFWVGLQFGATEVSLTGGVATYAQDGKGLEKVKSGLFSEDENAEKPEEDPGVEESIEDINASIDGTLGEKPATTEVVPAGENPPEAPGAAKPKAKKGGKKYKLPDGTIITEEEKLAREAAQKQAAASQAAEPGEPPVIDEKMAKEIFGKGWYIALWKIILVLLLYLLWTFSTDWLSTDAQKFKLGVGFWVPLVYGVFLGTLLLFWIIPWFWLGFVLLVLAYGIPLGCYIVPRNHAVSDAEQVLTWGHFRFLFSELMALFGVQIAGPKDRFETGWPVVLYSYGGDKDDVQQRLIRAHAHPGFQDAREILSSPMEMWPDAIMLDFSGSGVAIKYQVDGVWDTGKRFEGKKSNPAQIALKCLLGIDKETLKAKAEAERKAKVKEHSEGKKVVMDGPEDEEAIAKKQPNTGTFRMVYNYDYTFPEDRLRIKEAMDKLEAVPVKDKAAK